MPKISYAAHNSLLPFYRAWKIDPENSNYNLSFSYELEDAAHIGSIIASVQSLIELKSYLRQTFALEENQLIATIHDNLPASINFFTVSKADGMMTEDRLARGAHEINIKSPIKLNIVQFYDDSKCLVIFNIHHIVMDGYSLTSFITDLNRLLDGNEVEEESADEYVKKVAKEPLLQSSKKYTSLQNYIDEIKNAVDRINYSIPNKINTIWHYTEILPNELERKLMSLEKVHNISFFNLVLLAWSIFISKIYDQKDVLIQYPINIRADRSIFGCFVNLIPLLINLKKFNTYLSVIEYWHSKIKIFKEAAKSKVGDQLNFSLIPSFSYSDFTKPDELIIKNKAYESKSYPQIAHANLSVKYRKYQNKVFFKCELVDGIFPEYFASKILPRFFTFLRKLLTNLDKSFLKINIILPEEEKWLASFNDTNVFYHQDKTLIDLFDEIVKKYPNKVAVKAFNGKLSYSELNKRAERLAGLLVERGVKLEDVVGILIDNRLEMIVAILAVLKAGGAYLPFAYNTPLEKVVGNIRDSKAKFLLTLPHLVNEMAFDSIIIDINKTHVPNVVKYNKPSLMPNNLAYVIYTSGTTGYPKGILVEHRSVVNYVTHLIKDNDLDFNSIGSKYAGFGFDASVIEIYPILLSGGTLCMLNDKDKLDCAKVNRFLIKNKVNYAFLPTQFAELFLKLANKKLRTLIVGGDKMVGFKSQPYRVINAYGPTETTVQATQFLLDKFYENIPIGKPISNVQCYVVDKDFNIVPPGIIGELMIGGESLARGYINNRKLTDEKFVLNPFRTQKEMAAGRNLRLYKTGDLVRWLPTGNLEYIGRNDSQVKIRGYRVELGEIENRLTACPGIKQVIVLAKDHVSNDSGIIDKYIVAYYTSDKVIADTKIHDHLIKQLPEYMLPNMVIRLNEIPLTINGKLDKKKLPEPDFSRLNYSRPNNEKEELICSTFAKILGLKRVGVNSDFFKLGGNSIKAISLVVSLQNDFDVTVSDIFNLKTPRNIAQHITFSRDKLKKNLEHIKLIYKTRNDNNFIIKIYDHKLKNKIKKYFDFMDCKNDLCEEKDIVNILLTGAPGFLGSNILNQLLKEKKYNIYLTVRSDCLEHAFNRVNEKFRFYFDQDLTCFYNDRLFVLPADIEKEYLGLSIEAYQVLAEKIDSVIHAAALIKHYGEYGKFYSANVSATINLLEFSKLTSLKDFHYISTISVLDQGYIPDCSQYVFTEDDMADLLEGGSNVYIRSKYCGEKAVINYRQYGINSNIYRVGNLAFITSNYRIQENSEDNAFFNRIKCLLNLGIFPKEINAEEISPVDLTAEAIVKLFNKISLSNKTYHVFNPNLYNFYNFFTNNSCFKLESVNIDQFVDIIISNLHDPVQQAVIERFLLHQGWLSQPQNKLTAICILQDRTQFILGQLGFQWPSITDESFNKYLENNNFRKANLYGK